MPIRAQQVGLSDKDPLKGFSVWVRKYQIRIVLHMMFLLFTIPAKRRHFWELWARRLGIYPSGRTEDSIWINAATVAELRVAIALVRCLPENLPVVITTDPKDEQLGKKALGERAEFTCAPLPFKFAVRRFRRRYSPRQMILVDSDFFPLLYLHLTQETIPVSVVNGWVSRSLPNSPLLPLFHNIQIFCVREERDSEALQALGIPREKIFVTGDMKFDIAADPLPEVEAQMRKLAGDRPILIAGSTHPSETSHVLDAFERVGGGDRALLIIAPRFRPELTESILRERRIGFVRRSRLPVSGRPSVVLLDTVGELASLYRLASAVFIGWSLTHRGGGKNPIEPARFSIPIAVGPNMAHFPFQSELFDRAGAWRRVADGDGLAQAWADWLDHPKLAQEVGQRAAQVVESQQGLATSKTLKALRSFLDLKESDAAPLDEARLSEADSSMTNRRQRGAAVG